MLKKKKGKLESILNTMKMQTQHVKTGEMQDAGRRGERLQRDIIWIAVVSQEHAYQN